jgi:hypothetical protein
MSKRSNRDVALWWMRFSVVYCFFACWVYLVWLGVSSALDWLVRLISICTKPALIALALTLTGCYTSHTAYNRGVWSRTVAFGPGASLVIEPGGKVQATTKKAPTAAMAGGAFVGSAFGSFFRSMF